MNARGRTPIELAIDLIRKDIEDLDSHDFRDYQGFLALSSFLEKLLIIKGLEQSINAAIVTEVLSSYERVNEVGIDRYIVEVIDRAHQITQ